MSFVRQVQIDKVMLGPLRAVQHVARWFVWHSVGVSLVPDGQSEPARAVKHRRAA